MSNLPPTQLPPEVDPALAERNYERKPLVPRSPIVAAVLSIIPGLGHVYAGYVARGISYFALAVTMAALIYWTSVTSEFKVFPALIPLLIGLLALFWLWVIANAIKMATHERFVPLLGLLLVLLFTYFLGWQVTEVNLVKFFTEFSDTYNILTRILWPWNAAIVYPETLLKVDNDWINPCPTDGSEIPAQQPATDGQPWVTVDPPCGDFTAYVIEDGKGVNKPGTMITFRGGGFDPNEEVALWWEDPIGNEFRPQTEEGTLTVMTDAQGEFEITFEAPPYTTPPNAQGAQNHHVQARQVASVGAAELSPDFIYGVDRMIVTIFQALMATSFGIIFALPFSFLASYNLMKGNPITLAIYYAVRFVLNVVRSIEPIIWAVIATVWVGLGPFAGVIALALHTIASLGKLYSEAIESIDPGPIEALTATGANRLQTIMYAIIPQVIPPFLSFTVYRWDINVRMSTIIGFVGGGGIGQLLFQWIRQTAWREAGMAVWLIAFTVSLMDWASSELRKRFV
jgi:phosphonate transport system permease protein